MLKSPVTQLRDITHEVLRERQVRRFSCLVNYRHIADNLFMSLAGVLSNKLSTLIYVLLSVQVCVALSKQVSTKSLTQAIISAGLPYLQALYMY